VSIDDDLHERLEAAFGAISPHPAPVDDAIRGGRVIKGRRRLALAVGAGAVAVAAAVAVPSVLRHTAAPAPAATGRSQYTVTVQAPGPSAQPGLIASGTINGQRWWIIADRPGSDVPHPGLQVIIVAGPGVGAIGGADLDMSTLGTQAGPPGPAPLMGWTFGTAAQLQIGAVQADVSYVTVRLGNGTVLVLHPVTVYGTRAVAFALPIKATITEVAAYSRHGEIAYAVPFNWPSQGAWVVSWLRPGQAPLPRVSGLIGSGRVHGQAWSATAYQGPWGTCIEPDAGIASGGLCVPDLPAVTAVEVLNQGGTPEIAGGVAPASAARVVVTQPDGTKLQVRLVMVGGKKAFAFAVRPGAKPLRWVAYNSAGTVIASSSGLSGVPTP
jgi:hypothetical protein